MSNMKLTVKDEDGKARLLLHDGRTIIGIANMSWDEYHATTRALATMVITVAKDSIEKTLGKKLWEDAQRLVPIGEDSAEKMTEKLLEFGWNSEMIARYADALAKEIAQAMVGKMP